MESAVPELQGRRFDVIVIGGGINGSSAAQNLAAEGYECLVVDKEDFGSGASGRSGRMLHIGLRFFEARNPLRHFALHPGLFLNAVRGARQAMAGVSEHLVNAGKRIFQYRMCFPVYRDGNFRTWHLQAGLRLLGLLGDGRVSLDHEIIRQNHSEKVPFFEDFRDPEKLHSIACYNEFKFDWPERFCIDMLLDAQRNGATLVNYCKAGIKTRKSDGDWAVSLRDATNGRLPQVEVTAPVVLNMAGTWTDDVLPSSQDKQPLVQMTKGSHIVAEMPETYNGFGVAHVNRYGEPFYVLPLYKNLFSVGVTETPFNGDATNVSCTDDEVDFLIEECNSLLPGRRLSRKDVVSSWAGIRSLTPSEDGLETRVRMLHDLTPKGHPGIFALTGGPIMSHRSTGRLILEAVAARLKPSGNTGQVNYEPFQFSNSDKSPSFLADEPEVRVADLESSVRREFAKTLTDVLLRRTSLAWRRKLTMSEARKAAEIVGPLLHWSDEEQRRQVEQFMAFQKDVFRIPGTGCNSE
ncbi:MAG: FAD-dependent oxidoreductase [Gammaproteobacteria bacterium]|nr:FAD-dependent oxidoreductase [Gammaproteobacteria bacterium]